MAKSIIIDPGHGGTDPGANGFGVREKDWNLRISMYQYERLKELGADVAITRTTDKTLDSGPRTNLIKDKYDYCLSNHWNAFNGKARGIETIHSIFGNAGKRLATNIANALVKATGLPLRRVFSRKNSRGTDYYFMHRLTGSATTVIAEYGFIDNVTDHNWYKNDSNFYKAAEAVIEAVCKEIGIAYKAKGQVAKPSVPKGTPGKLYKVQAGAFKNKENAEKLHGRMESAGIDAFVIQENGLYKVQAGAYSVKANAEAQLSKVTKLVGDGFIVEEGTVKSVPKPTPKPASAPKPKPTPKKTAEQVAQEVAKGIGGWGNNPGRANKLKAAGYDASWVQNRVNQILGSGSNSNRSIGVGDTIRVKALYSNINSSINARKSPVSGYVASTTSGGRNPIRLLNKKGGYVIGYTRAQDRV